MDVIKNKMSCLKGKLEEAVQQKLTTEKELKKNSELADKKEEEAQELTVELSNLEDDLDKQEERLNNIKAKYDEAIKISDENERAHVELCNRGQTDTRKLDKLQAEVADLRIKNDNLDMEYQDAQAKLEEAENELDEQEERFSLADLRVKELEVDAVQTGNLLRSMEINEDVAAKSHTKSDHKVEEMKDNLAEIVARAEDKEEESGRLEKKLVELDEELHAAKERFQAVKSDYDALLAEVAEI